MIIFAPDALDAVYQGAVRFLYSKCAARPTDERLVTFDPFRREAEGRMQPGGTFAGAPVAALSPECLPLSF